MKAQDSTASPTESRAAEPPITSHLVLSNLYKLIQPLSFLFPSTLDQILLPTDTSAYFDLIHKTLIGSNNEIKFEPLRVGDVPQSSLEPGGRMRDMVENAQRRIWDEFAKDLKLEKAAMEAYKKTQRGKGKDVGISNYSQNLLTLGYGSNSNGTSVSIKSYDNTVVSLLETSPEWATLLERIGSTRMITLLSSKEIGLFIPLISGNDLRGKQNYLQITGISVIQKKPLSPVSPEQHPSKKRNRNTQIEQSTSKKRKRRHQRPPDPVYLTEAQEEDAAYWAQVDRDGSFDFDTVQVESTGAITILKKQETDGKEQLKDGKKRKLVEEEKATSKKRKLTKPSEIFIQRVRIYYSRSNFRYIWAGRERLRWGFSQKYILNQLSKIYPTIVKSDSSPIEPVEKQVITPRKLSRSKAIHLLKYIFPLRFGIKNNVFEFVKHDYFNALNWIDIDRDREIEIKALGNVLLPSRLNRNVVEMVEKLIGFHEGCNYAKQFDQLCPSKISGDSLSGEERSVILASISGEPISQPHPADFSLDISSNTTLLSSQPPIPLAKRIKPKFQDYLIPFHQVEGFIKSIILKVIPKAFWGSEKNFQQLWKHIQTFIRSRRFEVISLHFIMNGISLLDMEWLGLQKKGAKGQKINSVEMEMRKEVFSEFIYWFFDSFLINLINSNFYVTESGNSKTRTLYFRKDDWDTLTRPILDSLTTSTFERMNADEVEKLLNNRKLGFSYIRMLPKATGARPIVNLKRKIKKTMRLKAEMGPSINSVLSNAFKVLTFEKTRNTTLLGGSVFGPSEVYAKLKNFKLSLQETTRKLPRFFFVKVDVQSCYDTISQTKVLEIVNRLLVEAEYRITKYGRLLPINGPNVKISKMWHKLASPTTQSLSFPALAKLLAQELNYGVLCDQVVYPTEKRIDILRLIKEHLTSNLVKINGEYFKQIVGIPQGSILSSLFCAFVFGDFEQSQLKFTNNKESILMRMSDDFLLITTRKSIAKDFLNKMNEGNSSHGCFIGKEKSMVNFKYSLDGLEDVKMVDQSKDFPWCGMVINTVDLNIKTDLSRQDTIDISDAMSVERSKKPGATFLFKMIKVTKRQCHIIFTDTDHNSLQTVYLNVYQNMLLVATRFEAYVRDWHADPRKNIPFFLRAVKTILSYSYAAIVSGTTTKMAKDNNGVSKVRRDCVVWLGQHAFHRVLSRKPALFNPIIKALAIDLRAEKRGFSKGSMKRIAGHPANRFIENKKRKF